ncbi:MAG: type VII toxin-antitoxin system MntA family adenylyltransferase antitoxin [Tepidiformaceae bacterium]
MDNDDSRLLALRDLFSTVDEVVLAYLFGSRAEGREHPASDWDIALVTESPLTYERRFELEHAARQLVDGEVQLVPMQSAPIEMRFRVVATGRLLFQRSVEERVEWEANTMSRYYDALPGLLRWRAELIEGGNTDAAIRRYRKSAGKTRRLPQQAGGDSYRQPG